MLSLSSLVLAFGVVSMRCASEAYRFLLQDHFWRRRFAFTGLLNVGKRSRLSRVSD